MKNLLLAVLLFSLISCGSNNEKETTRTINKMNAVMIPFHTDSIHIEGDLNGFNIALETTVLENGLELVKLKMNRKTAATPPKIHLKWKFPSIDIAKFWNPNIGVNKANYYHINVNSRSTRMAPVISLMNTNDENRFTFAVADALNKINLSAYIKEEDAHFYCEVVFFDELYPAITQYETEIIIDRRNKAFYTTLNEITDWWATLENYTPAIPPQDAMRPVYSTWYSYHQNLDVEEVIEECKQSKEMGIEALIVDDGWQTMDNKRGYAYTGDWEPDRIPDMKGFV
ncbi:MAG: alpha-galactosidase, partial [Bacteroidales bacterium]|nr:alpha-galactosidase [Bacteroidales bacterium]